MPRINTVRRNRQPQQEQDRVRVQRGDTMHAIAQRHGVSLQDLIAANPQVRNPNLIHVGQELNLPRTARGAEQPPEAGRASGATYTVRTGDTLSAIAARHGVSVRQMMGVNPHLQSASAIRTGQVLNLPEGATTDRMANRWSDSGSNGARWRAFRGINSGRMLRRGHVGDDVRQLQEALITTGHMSQRQANTGPGIFGPLTQRAVKRFQRAQGLTADGIVGPRTRAALGRALSGGSRPGRGGGVAPPGPQPAPDRPSRRDPPPGRYDGTRAAPGTTNTRAWVPVDAPLQNQPGNRSAARYDQVLNQFGVGSNPRYRPRGGNTYCNIFAWDATRAMGAEIPHWVDQRGRPAGVGAPGAWEMDANAVNRWLNNQGASNGWRRVSARQAQAHANRGGPAVASWNNPGGIGHIGMIRPGELTSRGPALAQAGRNNFNNRHVVDGFGSRQPEYWVHD